MADSPPSAPDQFREPVAPSTAELTIKGSRFVAEVVPASTESEAEAAILAVRKRAYDATHHCTAYRVGADGAVYRFNDDGEPSGTAGRPILRQIDGQALTNVVVIVTRYYGGTKLGTGGLIRAYGDAAAEALTRAEVATRVVRVPVQVRFAYADTSPALHTIGQFDAEVVGTTYDADTTMRLAVRASEAQAFAAQFTDALRGRGTVTLL
ncbi:MAG: YigZ family protein [Bacteroidota bacterium]